MRIPASRLAVLLCAFLLFGCKDRDVSDSSSSASSDNEQTAKSESSSSERTGDVVQRDGPTANSITKQNIAEGQNEQPAEPAAKPIEEGTPQHALVTFMIAMMAKDERTLREVTVPTEDFDWLLKGKKLSDDEIKLFKEQVVLQEIRVLKPGDEITMPDKRKVLVKPEEIAEDRALLLPLGAPEPMVCIKTDHWRVDAGPLIAARKAVAEERENAEAQ